MDEVSSVVSIFKEDEKAPQSLQSMRDIISLAGVMSELIETDLSVPHKVFRLIRIFNFLNEEALGLSEPIENEETLFFRYKKIAPYDQDIVIEDIKRVVFVLIKYNWISRTKSRIKMRDLGKRMVDVVIRLANDSLAYYLNDDIARSLFQARRDAEISEAYDDKGISGGNRLASMIRNLEDAVELLKERELEFLSDQNALTQIQLINEMMNELDLKLRERLEKFGTVEQSLILTNLFYRGTSALAEGTTRSLGTINKILNFSSIQQTQYVNVIIPEKIRQYIVQFYDCPLDSDVADAHQILSFMEQNQYEEETLDGLWIPVKMAAPLSVFDIDETIDYIENYEPYTEMFEEVKEEIFHPPIEVNEDELEQLFEETKWHLTKELIQTDEIEAYLKKVKESNLTEVILQTGNDEWSHAINSTLAVSALINMKRSELDTTENKPIIETKQRSWQWIDREQGLYIVRRKSKHGK